MVKNWRAYSAPESRKKTLVTSLHIGPAPRQSDKSNEGLPPLFSFLKRKPMQSIRAALDGVPAAAEASGRTPPKLRRAEAAQNTWLAGRRRLVLVPSAFIHQLAAEAAHGGSSLQPGRGSLQDGTTSRRCQRRKCLRWPAKQRHCLWRLASVVVIELCHVLRCAFSEPSLAAAALQTRSA